MRSFLLALFLAAPIAAFCQSSAPASAVLPAPGNDRQATPPSMPCNIFSLKASAQCEQAQTNELHFGTKAASQWNAPRVDSSDLLQMPSLSVGAPLSHSLAAQNRMLPDFFPIPRQFQQWPNAKLEQIPTQWPNLRLEEIPTQWPKLKLGEITAQPPHRTSLSIEPQLSTKLTPLNPANWRDSELPAKAG
jgi:hypothetical protein